MTDIVVRAKQALWNRYCELNPDIEVDPRGYIKNSEKNRNLLQSGWMLI